MVRSGKVKIQVLFSASVVTIGCNMVDATAVISEIEYLIYLS